MLVCFMFFFCKQKTAYELRISDWSSDVCSSDLVAFDQGALDRAEKGACGGDRRAVGAARAVSDDARQSADVDAERDRAAQARIGKQRVLDLEQHAIEIERRRRGQMDARHARDIRSEEHTTELQSLMRLSYAVFCLKKKKKI